MWDFEITLHVFVLSDVIELKAKLIRSLQKCIDDLEEIRNNIKNLRSHKAKKISSLLVRADQFTDDSQTCKGF